MINFKEFVDILGTMCRADYTQKIKLLYLLHQHPCLLETECFENDETEMSPKSGIRSFNSLSNDKILDKSQIENACGRTK